MKTRIATDQAPQAIGPFSQAIRLGNLLFVSGQIPLDPGTGQLVQGDIEAQTQQVMENLKAIVAVNKNPKAPIFQVASVGVVADVLEFIPELTKKIAESK